MRTKTVTVVATVAEISCGQTVKVAAFGGGGDIGRVLLVPPKWPPSLLGDGEGAIAGGTRFFPPSPYEQSAAIINMAKTRTQIIKVKETKDLIAAIFDPFSFFFCLFVS